MHYPSASVGQALEKAKKELEVKAPDATALEQAEGGGIIFETRAVIGYQAPPGSEDEPRMRLFTHLLRPARAAQLVTLHGQNASEKELERVLAWALQEDYFHCPGSRLQIHFGRVDFIEFGFPGVD